MSGSWEPTSLPVRPGLYIRFEEAAAAQIKGGARGTVALPLLKYKNAADAKKFFTVEKVKEAADWFGEENIDPIRLILLGGAKEVLVYTVPAPPALAEGKEAAVDYTAIREAFSTRQFNVFVYPSEIPSAEQKALKEWCAGNREDEGKHFITVIGGTAEEDQKPDAGNTRSGLVKDDYVVNLMTGVEIDGTSYSSARYAPYVAGLIAGTGINKSITYSPVYANDVTKRLRKTEINAALEKGSLVLVHDGEKVKVEQGLVTSGKKIRAMRARQAISTDITKAAADSYIGKLDNNADGQAALISAIKAYLERLQLNNVLTDIVVTLDPDLKSEGDAVYLLIAFTEVDSMERIFLTIRV